MAEMSNIDHAKLENRQIFFHGDIDGYASVAFIMSSSLLFHFMVSVLWSIICLCQHDLIKVTVKLMSEVTNINVKIQSHNRAHRVCCGFIKDKLQTRRSLLLVSQSGAT